MRYRLLGPIEVAREDGTPVELTAPRERVVMAVLLLGANRVVGTAQLIDALWGECPPLSAANSLQVHISKLRKRLGARDGGGEIVKTAGSGYSIGVLPGELDVERFEHLLSEADGRGQAEVSALLGEALSLWRGPALSNVVSDALVGDAARLDELRLAALERRFEADLALGRHRDLVAELEAVTHQHPLREALRGQLMLALYRSGRQADALAVYRQGREALAEELGIDPSAALQALEVAILRQDPDIASPQPTAAGEVRTHGSVEPADEGAEPGGSERALRSRAGAGSRSHHLPRPVSSFIGRDTEATEVGRLVATTPLTTLVGPGGVGKTRLAIRIAHEAMADLPDAAWFVDLAPVRDPDLVPTRVAEVLGIPEQPGRPTLDYIVDALQSRRALVVLDNCEHLVDSCAAVSDTLMQRCPDLHVLATSREPLRVEGEHLFRLAPLATPEPALGESLAVVGRSEAVRLFVDRASQQRPDFELDDTTAGAVAAICRTLDGVPLAIELAAARLRAMSVFEVETRLADRFSLLSAGTRTASKRHQTLRSLIDWSYETLEPAEQALFRRLSVFAGGWSLETAEQVCPSVDLGAERVAETLGALVDKSLVDMQPGERITRYRLLETIRQYAAERLLASGETTTVCLAHASAYLSVVAQAEPNLRGSAQTEWLAGLDADLANIRVAAGTLVAATDRTEELLRLVAAQRWYWDIRGRYQEGINLTESALRLPSSSLPVGLRARALLSLLYLKTWSGDLATETQRLEEGIETARSIGDDTLLSEFLSLSIYSSYIRGDSGPHLARMAEESVACARRTGDKHTLGRVLAIATIGFDPRQRDLIAGAHQEAVDLFRDIGDRHWLGVALNNQASLEMDAGMVAQARGHLEEAISIVMEFLGDSSMLAMLLLNSGTLAVVDRDWAAAYGHFARAYEMAERVGSRAVRAASVMGEAWVASGTGDPRRGAHLHGLADALFEQMGETPQPTEARLTNSDRRKLRKLLGTEVYDQTFRSGHDQTATWLRMDTEARATAIFGTPDRNRRGHWPGDSEELRTANPSVSQ